MDTVQDHDTTVELAGPSNNPFNFSLGNERPAWDLENWEDASDSSEYEDNSYTSADDASQESRIPSVHRKPAITKAKLRSHKFQQENRARKSGRTHHRRLIEETQNAALSTMLSTPIHPPINSSLLAPHNIEFPALDKLWNLLDAWYVHRGRKERPPCAVEQRFLDHLYFIDNEDKACTYFDRQGKLLHVASVPLRGWEDNGLHIIIAFSCNRDPSIIKGRGGRLSEKNKDEEMTTFPFYIWEGISGDAEGWESNPSISKVVRHRNPSVYEPIDLKRRRVDDPNSGRPSPSKRRVRSPKIPQKAPLLLSESLPEVFAKLNEWMRNDHSGKNPAFVQHKQPMIHTSKCYPEIQRSFVDLDGAPVNVDVYLIGSGKKTVVVADGPGLGPDIISFGHFPKLPKIYRSYYRWTSTSTWIEPPCVFKVFGNGPFEPPRKYIEGVVGAGWLAQEVSLAQAVSPFRGPDCTRTAINLSDEPALSSHASSNSEPQRILSDNLPTPARGRPQRDLLDGQQSQQATCAALLQPDPGLQSVTDLEMAYRSEEMPPHSDQNQIGSEKYPIQIFDLQTAIKEEVHAELNPKPLLDSGARSATNFSTFNGSESLNRPVKSERKNASIGESVSLRFISASASQPRVRSFLQCNNVRLLFAHAKKGGLLEGEASAAPVLALRLPGMSEPNTIALGDNEDFDLFVRLLEDRIALSQDSQGVLIVDVTADQLE
jgi:hypothetical protein